MDTDPNHPGVITRHEACSGVSDLLKAQSPPLVTFDPLPVVFAAFDNASSVHQRRPSVQLRLGRGTLDASKRSQQIELNEFRLFLANLRYYFELYSMFVEMDTGDDGVIHANEFVAAQPQLEAWGLEPVADPEAEFYRLASMKNATADGVVDWDEFLAWAISHKLDRDDDDSDDEALLEVGGGGGHHHHHHHHEGEHQVHHNRRGTWAGQEIDARSMTKVDPSLLASLEG